MKCINAFLVLCMVVVGPFSRAQRPSANDDAAKNAKWGHYDRGATTCFASRIDQRFSYYLYIPTDYDPAVTRRYPLLVLIHGTERGAQRYRDTFSDFAEKHKCIILAPLFPSGIIEPQAERQLWRVPRRYLTTYSSVALSVAPSRNPCRR
jgi:predicted peptidase